MVEIEMVINFTLLTTVEFGDDNFKSLTLNNFRLGHSGRVKSLGNMSDDPEILEKEWKLLQLLILVPPLVPTISSPDGTTSIFQRYQHNIRGAILRTNSSSLLN